MQKRNKSKSFHEQKNNLSLLPKSYQINQSKVDLSFPQLKYHLLLSHKASLEKQLSLIKQFGLSIISCSLNQCENKNKSNYKEILKFLKSNLSEIFRQNYQNYKTLLKEKIYNKNLLLEKIFDIKYNSNYKNNFLKEIPLIKDLNFDIENEIISVDDKIWENENLINIMKYNCFPDEMFKIVFYDKKIQNISIIEKTLYYQLIKKRKKFVKLTERIKKQNDEILSIKENILKIKELIERMYNNNNIYVETSEIITEETLDKIDLNNKTNVINYISNKYYSNINNININTFVVPHSKSYNNLIRKNIVIGVDEEYENIKDYYNDDCGENNNLNHSGYESVDSSDNIRTKEPNFKTDKLDSSILKQ